MDIASPMANGTKGVSAEKKTAHFIVVGAGFGGLTAAIELERRGYSVEVLESAQELTKKGDSIQLGSSATRIISKWGSCLDRVTESAAVFKTMVLFNAKGDHILNSPLPTDFDGYPILFPLRGWAQSSLIEYAQSRGIKIRLGTRVSSYFEEDDSAGVDIGTERLYADGVIAGDGVHSLGRKYILGRLEHPRTSGFAVYRASFPLSVLSKDPRTAHFCDIKEDLFQVWIGTDVHAILCINTELQNVVMFCTHKDYHEVAESWNFPGDRGEMLKVVEGWDETVQTLLSLIPQDELKDWKLLWRDPIKRWVSDKGRVLLLGDAAHPHLPTSGTGATQAIEDGATIAALCDALGTGDIPLVFRAFEKIRYERTSLTQRMGWETRHRWHQTDWDFVKKDPNFLKMPQPRWLYGHDAAQYALDRANDVRAYLKDETTSFQSTNIPDGHIHEDWTIEKMLALEGKQAQEHFYKVANQ